MPQPGRRSAAGDGFPDADELDLETNEADAAEQRRAVGEDEDGDTYRAQLPDDADPANAVDQIREVGPDEDDYR